MIIRQNSLRVGSVAAMVVMLFAGSAWGAVPKVTYTDLYTLGLPPGFDNVMLTPARDQPVARGQVVGSGGGTALGNTYHAVLWTPFATSGVDLNPTGFAVSAAFGTNGTQQVGYGYPTTGGDSHALLWNGSAASYVDLNPAGFTSSGAKAISGAQQVGSGYGPPGTDMYHPHALLWSGSAESFVDLNPSGFTNSEALGTSGAQQVGYGYGSPTGGFAHALLWSGSADSFVDLNPSGSDIGSSYAVGTSGTQQVGQGEVTATGNYHALLWTGSAVSLVDLNPRRSGYFLGPRHQRHTAGGVWLWHGDRQPHPCLSLERVRRQRHRSTVGPSRVVRRFAGVEDRWRQHLRPGNRHQRRLPRHRMEHRARAGKPRPRRPGAAGLRGHAAQAIFEEEGDTIRRGCAVCDASDALRWIVPGSTACDHLHRSLFAGHAGRLRLRRCKHRQRSRCGRAGRRLWLWLGDGL